MVRQYLQPVRELYHSAGGGDAAGTGGQREVRFGWDPPHSLDGRVHVSRGRGSGTGSGL